MKTHTIKKLQRIGKLVKAHIGSDPHQPGFKNKVLRLAQKNDLGVHYNTLVNGMDIILKEINPINPVKNMRGFEYDGSILTITFFDGTKVKYRQFKDTDTGVLKSVLTEDEYFRARDFRC